MTIFELIKTEDVNRVSDYLLSNPHSVESVDENGVTPLLLACYHRKREVAELIAARKKLTIHEAAAIGNVQQVRARLSEDPSSLNAYAADGFFPLALSLFFGHDEIAFDLLERGANVNQKAKNNQSVAPLHAAIAGKRDPRIVEELIRRGADVDAKQQAGITPLHNAAAVGSRQIAEVLLRAGASIKAKMDDGTAVSDMAEKFGHSELAMYLRQYTANHPSG